MTIEISSTKSEKAKILILTATNNDDQHVLEEIVKMEAYISVNYDPNAHTISELSIPLIPQRMFYVKITNTEQRRAGW